MAKNFNFCPFLLQKFFFPKIMGANVPQMTSLALREVERLITEKLANAAQAADVGRTP